MFLYKLIFAVLFSGVFWFVTAPAPAYTQDLPNQQGVYRPFAAPIQFSITVPLCFDNLDNDRDGLIDIKDPGCENNSDNDEADPEPIAVKTIEEPVILEQGVEEIITKVVTKARENKTYRIIDEQILNNPQVETATTNIAAPIIVAAAAANVSTAISFTSLFAYLQGFVTQPFLLFSRRRKKQWGQVYSALTKLPLDLALVRLFSAPDGDLVSGKLLQTRVTDKQGRYLFLANPGTYVIKVTKQGYTFPSIYLQDKTSDLDFMDLYHGGLIRVNARATALAQPIPLDPQEAVEIPSAIARRRIKSRFQKTIAWSGPMMAIASVVITPNITTISLLTLQFALLGLFKRLAAGAKRPKSWGLVKDAVTGKPVVLAVARIFDAEFNKLLETQITDKQGHYAFLVGKGSFYITVQKQEYSQYKSDIFDLAKAGVDDIVKQDIGLERVAKPPSI